MYLRQIDLLMSDRNFSITLHASYNDMGEVTYGPPHHIYDFLKERGLNVYLISHSLSGNHKTEVTNFNGESFVVGIIAKNYFLNLMLSLYIDTRYCWSIKGTYIGVNPINGFAGAFLKVFKRSGHFIYFSADYADKRFSNPLANFIYHFLDRFSLRFADEVWGVSTRIQKKRKSQGIPDYKNKLLPNSPSMKDINIKPYNGNHDLVIVSHLSKSLNLHPILQVLKNISQGYPSVRLKIIGTGPEENYFRSLTKELGVEDKVIFMGQKSHKEVLDILVNSFIGIALYTSENAWNYYGDSMKAREYLACGLPVIINNIPSTADDIKIGKSGLVLDQIIVSEIVDFLDKCLKDEKFYNKLRNNSLNLAKKYDKIILLENLFRVEV